VYMVTGVFSQPESSRADFQRVLAQYLILFTSQGTAPCLRFIAT